MLSTQNILDKYRSRIKLLKEKEKAIRQKAFWFSLTRLLLFAGVTVSIYFYYRSEFAIHFLFFSLAGVVLFFYIVRRHSEIKYQQNILGRLIDINLNEIDVLQQKPSFLSDGDHYHHTNSFSHDLDIFGSRSLFHILNRCFSEPGQRILASWLVDPTYNKSTIKERQAAIKSVCNDVVVRQEFLAHGITQLAETKNVFIPENELIKPGVYRRIKNVRWLPSVIMISGIILSIVLNYTNIILYGFLVNLILTGLFMKSTLRVMQSADLTLKNLKNYKEPLKVLLQAEYDNTILKRKKLELLIIEQSLSSLEKRYNLLENRSNMVVGLLLNGLIGYDFIALSLLQNWYETHSSKIPGWLDQIGWFEALFSMSTFSYNNPSYNFPSLDEKLGITGKNIRHPFIPEEQNVGNRINFTPPLKVILLTGSNMSGKSTFLRSMGVNQVLALAGSVVAADKFQTGLYSILTSFRKADSIHEHTSLFYDELKKLRYIISTLSDSNKPALILLDEILRGTNSDDKFHGSKEVLLRLKEYNAMTMLATHDIALAKLEEDHGPIIQNYSFESQVQNGELHFDYTLHKGVAINKNATFLMEKMGIIESNDGN